MIDQIHKEEIEVFAYQIAKQGKICNGDSYFILATEEYFVCALADGLGSGERANESSTAVMAVVKENHQDDVQALMKKCNTVLKDKRGAAVAVLKVFFRTLEFEYSCVGNIRFMLYAPSGKMTFPLPVSGYLSGKPQVFRSQRYSYEKNSMFIIHSDGLNLRAAKSFLRDAPSVECLMNQLKRDEGERTDDVTYIIGKLL